jgi:ABC-type branched-subunit amino acid transport system substrate-binding protein
MPARLAAVAVGLAIAASFGGGCGSSDDVVKLGVLTDCQGPFHAYEDAQLSGAELPFLRRGARLAGTGPSEGVTPIEVGGRRVELVRGCQESGEHTVFIEEARRLIESEKVDAIVGGASVVARDLADHYPDVPFVSAFWNEQEVTLRSPARNLFRFSPDYAQDAAGLGAYAYRHLGWRRAAIVAGNVPPGWDGAAAFTAEFCALGGKVVGASYRSIYTGRPDVVARALATKPDGVAAFLTGFDDHTKILGSLAAGLDDPRRLVTWSQTIEDPTVMNAIGAKLDGVVVTTWLPPTPPSPILRRHRALYRTAFPGLPATFGDQSWVLAYTDAVESTLTALERTSGGDVRRGLLDELGRVSVDLPGGRVTLDRNRQAVRDGYLARVVWSDGKSSFQPVRVVPRVEQTFGGLLSAAPPPGPGSQPCVKAQPPAWAR